MITLKYIVLKKPASTKPGESSVPVEMPFLFSMDITHADFLETVRHHRDGLWKTNRRGWTMPMANAECIAGGFYRGGECFGVSESIGIKSRGKVDAALINSTGTQ